MLEVVEPQSRVAFGESQGFDERIQTRLRGHARKWGERTIDDVHTLLRGHEVRRELPARSIVRVEVNRHVDLGPQRLHEPLRRVRLQQPGHVFDGQKVRAEFDEFLGEVDVILQRILVSLGVENIPRVADGGFRNGVGLADRVDRQPEVRQVIAGVENAEDIHPCLGGLFDERIDHVVRIIGVPDRTRGPQ